MYEVSKAVIKALRFAERLTLSNNGFLLQHTAAPVGTPGKANPCKQHNHRRTGGTASPPATYLGWGTEAERTVSEAAVSVPVSPTSHR